MKAFSLRKLSVLAYANGFTLWHYKAEAGEDVVAKGHFSKTDDVVMAVGDIVLISGPEHGMMAIYGQDGTLVPMCEGLKVVA